MTEGIWIALIGLVATIFGSLGLWFGRRKMRAETTDILTKAALSLVEPLERRLQDLEEEISELRKENKRLEVCIDTLEKDNRTLRSRVKEMEEVNHTLSGLVDELRERERQARFGKSA